MILIKNAQVFAPKALGKKDVLLAYDKILEIADCIEPWRDDLTVIDAAGKMLVPGFIDQHVHIVGGGGEGGFDTRTPEFQLSKAVTSGVTTLVGLLGTDGYTKSPELLLAKTKALLQSEEAPDNYTLHLDSHENMESYASPESVSCIVFNFGYLPGGDHTLATRPSSSIAALNASLRLLKKGGLLSLCIYSGGDSGFQERDAILNWLAALPSRKYLVIKSDFYNRPNHPPIPVQVIRLK